MHIWHRWSKWEQADVVVSVLWREQTQTVTRQFRTCEKCGKVSAARIATR